MKPHARGAEEGSALVEFVVLGVLLLVPLLYLTLMVARVQAGSYAATQAARAFMTADTEGETSARASAAAAIAFADHGFPAGDSTLMIACASSPCLTPEARIDITASVRVPLPLIPAFARSVIPLEVPITATHMVVVDRFRGAG